mmetsp:Transcript_2637/g.6295  ORF Transcript_2637/g.6295 Transcript_2637/m.6295 type:complete len:206 (-) Transcript_2637:268-885(-)
MLDELVRVNAVGQSDAIDGAKAVLRVLDERPEAKLAQPPPEQVVAGLVPLPHRGKALPAHLVERLAHGEEQAHGGSVVVGPRVTEEAPLLADLKDVEVENVHWGLAVLHLVDGAVTEVNGRQAGRAAQALLRAGVHQVDAPLVGEEGLATESADRVHAQEGAVLGAQLCDALELLPRARAALAVGCEEEVRLVLVEGGSDLVKRQ